MNINMSQEATISKPQAAVLTPTITPEIAPQVGIKPAQEQVQQETVIPKSPITPEMLQAGIELMAQKNPVQEQAQQEAISQDSQPLKEDAIKNLTELRGYFDATLTLMEIAAIANDTTFEPQKLKEQWYKLCDESIILLSSTNTDLTPEQADSIKIASTSMKELADLGKSNLSQEQQQVYLDKLPGALSDKGNSLIEASDLVMQVTGNTKEHNAVINGDIDALLQRDEQAVIHCKSDALHTPNKDGLTPLIIAIQSENVEMLSAMVSVGINLDHTALGCTAIELAINTNNADVVTALFSDRDSTGQLYQTRATEKLKF